MRRTTLRFSIVLALTFCPAVARGQVTPTGAAAYFDFSKGTADLVHAQRELRLHGARLIEGRALPRYLGARVIDGRALEFSNSFQFAEMDNDGMAGVSRMLDGIEAMSVGGWFYCRRWGEQTIFCRGVPKIAPLGERVFSPNERYVNFCLGTDQRGFFFGTVNGNGGRHYVHVTLNQVPIYTWNQLVVVKDAEGYQKFYQNGTLVHTDHDAARTPKVWPFHEAGGQSEPIRLSMPMGGLIGEAWVFPRELSAAEVRKDGSSGYLVAVLPSPR